MSAERAAASARAAPPPRGQSPRALGVLAFVGIVLTSLTLRPAVTSISPLFEDIRQDTGAGTLLMSVIAMAPPIMFGLSAASAATLVRRVGLEPLTVAAMVICAAGLVGRALVSQAALVLLFTMVTLWGMGLANVTLPPLIRTYAADRIATATTCYIAALQIGTLVPALVAVPVANDIGWRWSLGLWAAVPAVALVPWAVVLAVGRSGASAADPVRRLRMSHNGLAICLGATMGLGALITFTLFAWMPTLLVDAGASREFSGSMLALFAALGFFPSLVVPRMVVRMRDPYVIVVVAALCYVIGLLGLWFVPMTATAVWVVLAGLGTSVFPLCLTLITTRARTREGVASLSAFVHAAGYLIASIGPLLFGLLNEATSSWGPSFGMMIGCAIVVLVCGRIACRPRYVEDDARG